MPPAAAGARATSPVPIRASTCVRHANQRAWHILHLISNCWFSCCYRPYAVPLTDIVPVIPRTHRFEVSSGVCTVCVNSAEVACLPWKAAGATHALFMRRVLVCFRTVLNHDDVLPSPELDKHRRCPTVTALVLRCAAVWARWAVMLLRFSLSWLHSLLTQAAQSAWRTCM